MDTGSNAMAAELAELRSEVAQLRTVVEAHEKAILAILTVPAVRYAGITLATQTASIKNTIIPQPKRGPAIGSTTVLQKPTFNSAGLKVS